METSDQIRPARMTYCSKLWISSVLMGPMLWHICLGLHYRISVGEFFQFWIGCSGLALLFSFPSFILLSFRIKQIQSRGWPLSWKRLILSGWAVALACLAALLVYVPVWLLFPQQNGSFLTFKLGIGIGCFIAPLIGAIYFFRWPANAKG